MRVDPASPAGGGGGVASFGMRRQWTGLSSVQPSAWQTSCAVTRPLSAMVSTTCPSRQNPRTRTPAARGRVVVLEAMRVTLRRATIVTSTKREKATVMASVLAPIGDVQNIADRLKAVTVAHRDAQEVAERTAARWRQTIMEALDAGMTQLAVAQLAGVSRSRIHAVIYTEERRRA